MKVTGMGGKRINSSVVGFVIFQMPLGHVNRNVQ